MQQELNFKPTPESGEPLNGVEFAQQLTKILRSIVTRRYGPTGPADLQKNEVWTKELPNGQTVDLVGDGIPNSEGVAYSSIRATTITLANGATAIDVGYYNMVVLETVDTISINLSTIIHKLPPNEILKIRNNSSSTITLVPSDTLVLDDEYTLPMNSYIELLFDGTVFELYRTPSRAATQDEVSSGVTIGDVPAFVTPESLQNSTVANADYATRASEADAALIADTALTAINATKLKNMVFNWNGQSGQPTWLWGSNDGTNHYVWNPGAFNVNYANSAGSTGALYGANDARITIGGTYGDFDIFSKSDIRIYSSTFVRLGGAANHCFAFGSLFGCSDNKMSLGGQLYRWSVVYAVTGSINTSDAREKTIVPYDEALFKAWSKVKFQIFQFNSDVEKKGADGARLHAGYITQQIGEAFVSEGLDPARYGLWCYDEWDAQDAEYETYTDENGQEQQRETSPAHEAGNRYSLRYEECLCVEAAYQRWRADKLEDRIAKLENILLNNKL